MGMKKIPVAALAALVALALASPAIAAAGNTPPSVQERAEKAFKEGAEQILRALRMLILAVPQYEMPEVLDNGDIILRRKHPAPPEEDKAPADDDANT